MNIKSKLWITFLLLILAITACQGNQEEADEGETVFLPQSSSGSSNQGYPAQDEADSQNDDAYPVENESMTRADDAYPISSEDLRLLNRSWFLHGYSEDGIAMDPASKTITFAGDTFEITTGENTLTGTWTARLNFPNAILVLDTVNEGTLFYEIIILNETNLKLQTAQDQSQIEEDYIPVD